MGELYDKFKEYLESDQGKLDMEEWANMRKHENMLLEKYNNYIQSLSEEEYVDLIKKVHTKYDSDEYYKRWINRGYFPERYLESYFADIVQCYGEQMDSDDFYSSAYSYKGSKVVLTWGQGEVDVKVYINGLIVL